MSAAPLSWLGIARMGLVQAALGAVVVLTTSTLNRVMVVELTLPAVLPGALVAFHYAIQMLRPRLGHGSDVTGRATPWILGGMATLASGGMLATLATVWMATAPASGLVLAILAFAMIGLGVGAAGTSLLALLARRVAERRRAAAATIVWIMMIAGFVVTAATSGALLDPFSHKRLIAVAAGVCGTAFVVATLAILGIEGRPALATATSRKAASGPFMDVLRDVWSERKARAFTIFVFVSMLAYSAQDLILEPFAGLVFAFTPGESTSLSGVQHSGTLIGMIVVALAGTAWARGRLGSLRFWIAFGCLVSAVATFGLTLGGIVGQGWPLKATVWVMGFGNGAFSIAAIASMMALAGAEGDSRHGLRMGLFGAAQAIAFAGGGFLGTVAVDLARALLGSPAVAYGSVFALQALLWLVSLRLAAGVDRTPAESPATTQLPSPGLAGAVAR